MLWNYYSNTYITHTHALHYFSFIFKKKKMYACRIDHIGRNKCFIVLKIIHIYYSVFTELNNYHHTTERYHNGAMDLPNTDSVVIKGEPGSQEEDGSDTPFTNLDIDLPDVKKKWLQYSENTPRSSELIE